MHFIQSYLCRLLVSTSHFTYRPPTPPHMLRPFQFAANMTGGRNSSQRHRNPRNGNNNEGHRGSKNGTTGFNGGHSKVESGKRVRKNVQKDVLEDPKLFLSPEAEYERNFPSLGPSNATSYNKSDMRTKVDSGNDGDHFKAQSPVATCIDASSAGDGSIKEAESLLELSPASFGNEQSCSPTKKHKFHQTSPDNSGKTVSDSKILSPPEPSDIGQSAKEGSEEDVQTTNSLEHEAAPVGNQTIKDDEALLPTSFGKKQQFLPKIRQTSSGDLGKSNSASPMPFDICFPSRQEIGGQVLRPGMVLLKRFISLYDQIKIVKKCQELGKGPGGFYQPGYNDGAKLRLQMMCLGQDWDPQTRAYGKRRAIDGSEPPAIPAEFELLVIRAIQYSQDLIGNDAPSDNVEGILPSISPDICIVNFYPTHGRLGLHQDRDESRESLRKGLPVVSFSIGDSAEFLYSDWRDVDSAERVVLESGDVLIFGGKSRHIFHGVSCIFHKSAPWALRDVANFKPGRLNLTFRQY